MSEETARPRQGDEELYDRFLPAMRPPVPAVHDFLWPWAGSMVRYEHVGSRHSPVRLLMVPGLGTNVSVLRPFARRFSTAGTCVTVPDLPGQGQSSSVDPRDHRYGHWRSLLVELARAEQDRRPLVVMGMGLGGGLAYDVAAAVGADALVATALVDPTEAATRRALGTNALLTAMASRVARTLPDAADRRAVPVRRMIHAGRLSNDRELRRTLVEDRGAAGGQLPLGWFEDFWESAPDPAPEQFTTPVVLMLPEEDRLTPAALSESFAARLAGPVRQVPLPGAGHLPVEGDAVERMTTALGTLVSWLCR